ncbi:histidine utilization repressor [Ameyamaea chiangmaiensis]|uniref:Histidine utilization repressor n=2 Tax=Ameyamaea chiangmaiensis TaxID=442969 RepID=A0A850P8R4_9PROT|nr:histidine utilization repressor [Ameyamaea chiangmaiensis]NVN38960.1 histidine utilization repressor [Ameyamaea chiangmaiensis]
MPSDRRFATDPSTVRPVARYEQVKRYITDRIADGVWHEGDRLPSEMDLVDALGVSRMTVNRALRELTGEGVITRAQGVGSFVAPAAPRAELLELHDIADEITRSGHTHRARVLMVSSVRADMALAAAFDVRPGTKLFHSVIVHDEDETPLQVEERYVAPHFLPDYLDLDLATVPPHRHLSRAAPAEQIEHVIFAVTPCERLRAWLDLPTPEPCLQLMRRTWVNGRVVMRGTFTSPGSRYSIGGRYIP